MNTFPELETDTTQGNPSLDLTEEEATRYDRQMRLWGIEAQQRMRNATILVLNLRGVATEAIKNMVLAGIGKLIIVDRETVSEQDLGAGFFFRDGDVGLNRLDAAKSRIESLNPLVTVETVTDTLFSEGERLESIVKNVDLVCVTDWDRDGLIKLNEICRKHQKPFYAGGTYGLTGYIFCDLLSHDYLAPDRSAPKEQPKTVKATTVYTPLSSAIRYRWSGLSKRQTKEVNPALFFAIMAIWQFQAMHGDLPKGVDHTSELEALANKFILEADVNKQILPTEPRNVVESLSTTASHEFSPVCAIVGGMLAQDILKALGGREPPIGNFFLFDGSTGGGTDLSELTLSINGIRIEYGTKQRLNNIYPIGGKMYAAGEATYSPSFKNPFTSIKALFFRKQPVKASELRSLVYVIHPTYGSDISLATPESGSFSQDAQRLHGWATSTCLLKQL